MDKALQACQTLQQVKAYCYETDLMPDDTDAIVERAAEIARNLALEEAAKKVEAQMTTEIFRSYRQTCINAIRTLKDTPTKESENIAR